MALQMSYTSQYGSIHPSAYFKVSYLEVKASTSLVDIFVEIFNSAADKDKTPLSKAIYCMCESDYATYLSPSAIDPESKNHIQQSYEYLKTLPDFTGALDV